MTSISILKSNFLNTAIGCAFGGACGLLASYPQDNPKVMAGLAGAGLICAAGMFCAVNTSLIEKCSQAAKNVFESLKKSKLQDNAIKITAYVMATWLTVPAYHYSVSPQAIFPHLWAGATLGIVDIVLGELIKAVKKGDRSERDNVFRASILLAAYPVINGFVIPNSALHPVSYLLGIGMGKLMYETAKGLATEWMESISSSLRKDLTL